MKNTAKKFPLPTGEQWARLPERVLALEQGSSSEGKIYKVTLSQGLESEPEVLQTVKNTTGADFTFQYENEGAYKIISSIPLFEMREKVIITLSSGKFNMTVYYALNSNTEIILYTYSLDAAALRNELLTGNLLTIEILD